jgi:hypothetical protein
MVVDSAIQVLIVTSSTNLVIVLAKLVAKSKCSEFNCCGCSVKRDVELEEQAEEFERMHPATMQPN